MTMSNRQWKAMLTRNGEAKPRQTRAERRELEKAWNAQCNMSFEARVARMRDEMNADISREMGSYYGSNEDL